LELAGVAEDHGGHGPAHIDVDAFPDTLAVGLREARQTGVHAALHEAARLDGIEGFTCLSSGAGKQQCRTDSCEFHEFHSHPFPIEQVALNNTEYNLVELIRLG